MKNKVKWQRGEDGTAIPFLFEEIKPNHWGWVNYKSSKLYKPDNNNFSKGYLTFLTALKLGYEVIHEVK